MNKCNVLIFLMLIAQCLVAQSTEGYWDNIRTTSTTLTLAPRERIYVQTEPFPRGTTEVVYRITVLDDNEKISSNLISVLKSIPDPSGISQGSAGAVFLLSTISGEDKCKYGVYSSLVATKKYIENSKTDLACYFQNNPINKEAKLVSLNSNCAADKNDKLYFVFTSDNWIMKQKILLEVVPWVNYNAAKGWTVKAKQEVLDNLKQQPIFKNCIKKEVISALFLEELLSKQSFFDYKQLLAVEKNNLTTKLLQNVLVKSGEIKTIINFYRNQALALFNSNKLENAIVTLQEKVIDTDYANANDYANLGKYYLFSKQYEKAFQTLQKAEQLDAALLTTQLYLSYYYLLTNQIGKSKLIHKKYKSQNISATTTWIEQATTDLKLLEDRGFSAENFKKIKSVLID